MANRKSKRLIDLLTLLLNARYPVAREAIRSLEGYPRGEEAFHRQFERDKKALRELGFPLVEVGGEESEGGYALERARLRLPDIRLTAEEMVALALARRLGGFHALVGGAVRDALGKLGVPAMAADLAPGVVLAAPPARTRIEEERLRALESALAQNHRLKLTYRALGETRPTVREFDPFGLYAHAGAWYAVGFDHLRSAVRVFRASRIEKLARVTRGAAPDFASPRDFRLERFVGRAPWQVGHGRETDVVVRFGPGESWRVGRLRGPGVRVHRSPAGGLEVRFKGANPEAFVPWLLGLGRGVEIVSPPALRDEARSRALAVSRAHAARKR